jgi:hypothetical protein
MPTNGTDEERDSIPKDASGGPPDQPVPPSQEEVEASAPPSRGESAHAADLIAKSDVGSGPTRATVAGGSADVEPPDLVRTMKGLDLQHVLKGTDVTQALTGADVLDKIDRLDEISPNLVDGPSGGLPLSVRFRVVLTVG